MLRFIDWSSAFVAIIFVALIGVPFIGKIIENDFVMGFGVATLLFSVIGYLVGHDCGVRRGRASVFAEMNRD